MSTAVPAAPPTAPPATTPAHAPVAARWLVVGAAIALGGVLFHNTFSRLLVLWDRDANYSHGYLVVVVSLALAYRIYRRVGPPVHGEVAWGLSGIVLGVLCQWLVTVVRVTPLSYLGLVCVLRGLLVCAGGRVWASAFNFPLVFLFFMFPLPVTWTSYAALWLQDVVARVSETVLGLFVVCHRVGHSIRIAGVDQSLVVAEECSGLGQIVSFVAFAVLLGHLLSRPMWFRGVLLLASVPIAIAANTLRVVLMNLAAAYYGTKWMGGTLHDAPALFSIPVGVVMFLLFDRVLSRLVEQHLAQPQAPETPAPTGTTSPVRGLAVAAGVLLLGVGVQTALAAHIRSAGEPSYPTLANRLDSLPLTHTDPATGQVVWTGVSQPDVRDAVLAKLPFPADDMLVRLYRHAGGGSAQLYMVHSRAGEDRLHHPEICIRDVSGTPEDISFRKQVPIREDGSATAQRFRFQTVVGRSIVVYYWHYTLRPAPDAGRTRLQSLHQRVGVTAPSVTVQLSTSGDDSRALAAVEQFLLPGLDDAARRGVLPPLAEAGCHRVPVALDRKQP